MAPRRRSPLGLLALALALAGACQGEREAAPGPPAPAVDDPDAPRIARSYDRSTQRWTARTLGPTYRVDSIYRSMQGPQTMVEIELLPTEEPELLWITGYRARMVAPDGEAPVSQEFMCHSNLDIDPALDETLLGRGRSGRLFTLSQGQYEIELPDGFGVPILSNERLKLWTQVLNLNHRGEALRVRHRVDVTFARDRELASPPRALVLSGAQVLVSLEGDGVCFNLLEPTDAQRASCSSLGEHALGSTRKAGLLKDRHGRPFSLHWVVPPGRHTNHALIGSLSYLEEDSTIHYISTHLHPFAESMELRDLTSGETVYKSLARGLAQGIGLEHVDFFSSLEGLPIHGDHEYAVVSTYDNTTPEAQDSMAVMFVYFHDRQFDASRWRESRRTGG